LHDLTGRTSDAEDQICQDARIGGAHRDFAGAAQFATADVLSKLIFAEQRFHLPFEGDRHIGIMNRAGVGLVTCGRNCAPSLRTKPNGSHRTCDLPLRARRCGIGLGIGSQFRHSLANNSIRDAVLEHRYIAAAIQVHASRET
jgi:hypothetical protein